MIKLKKLVINNFGSFKLQQVINFPDSGLLLLHGENGSGKSSLLKAIAYCLDFLDEPASEFINWENEEDIFVELTLVLNGKDLIIQRGNGLYKLEYGAIKTVSGDTSKKIKELLVAPQFMSIMSYRSQGAAGNFSKLKPPEKQEFLSELQSLNDFELLIENTEKHISALEAKIEDNKKQYQTEFNSAQYIVENIDRESKLMDSIDNSIKEVQIKLDTLVCDTSEFDCKINLITVEKANIKPDTSLDAQIESLEKALSDNHTVRGELEDEERELLKDQNTVLKDVWSLRSEVEKIPSIELQIEKLKKQTCPTCEQTWNKSDNALKDLEIKLYTLEGRRSDLEADENQNKAILELLKINRAKMRQEMDAGVALMSQKEQLREQRIINNSKSKILDKELENLNTQKTNTVRMFGLQQKSLKDQIVQFENNKSQYTRNIEVNTKKIETIDQKLESIQASEKALLAEIAFEKDILTSSKDFLRLITEDTLRLISAESSTFVQTLPNAKNFFIKFDTSKLNKNGKIKKEIVLQIFKSGKEVPFRRLSGGETSSVHLATDLAVSKVLSARTGKNLGWFILDESLDGMRINNKIEALSMLKTLSKDKLIIVVDHTSEISEVFDKVLHVIKKDSGSTVQLI